MRKKSILPIIMLLCIILFCACNKDTEISDINTNEVVEDDILEESSNDKENQTDIEEQIEKGYDLPVSDEESEEAETDSKRIMELILDIYKNADKGDTSNVVLSDETVYEMVARIKETGSCVKSNELYYNLENYKQFEKFLNSCTSGNRGSAVIYEINSDGGIGRSKYIYDGNDMYVLEANVIWNDDYEPVVTYLSYTRLKEWKYTDKGWFGYELCVPEYPDVTEVLDGGCIVRVTPMTEENREMSEKYVLAVGYQGNNLLCSNWDADSMGDLDYNGLYEYLYRMKYGESFNPDDYPSGIPKEDFESLIMEYLPITSEKIQKFAVFDEENQTYVYASLGYFSNAPSLFVTSVPEVTEVRENGDGTVTLTVDAVCGMIAYDDAVITHELTVRFAEDGSFQYIGNKISDDGISNIPEYQYRISKEE